MQRPLGTSRLATAALVFGGGAGVGDPKALCRAAAAFDAAVGGTAALCDGVRLPRVLLVGASGTLLSARCYVGFGVHGAPHHVAGLDAVEHVISVNSDPWAPLHDRADVAIVASSGATLAALTRLRGPDATDLHGDFGGAFGQTAAATPAPAGPPGATTVARRLESLLLPPRGVGRRVPGRDPRQAAKAIAQELGRIGL